MPVDYSLNAASTLKSDRYRGVMFPLPKFKNMTLTPFRKIPEWQQTVNAMMLYSIRCLDYMIGSINYELGTSFQIQINDITRPAAESQRLFAEYQAKLDSGEATGNNPYANTNLKPSPHNTGSAIDIEFTNKLHIKDFQQIDPRARGALGPADFKSKAEQLAFRDLNFVNTTRRPEFTEPSYTYCIGVLLDTLIQESTREKKVMDISEFQTEARGKMHEFIDGVWHDIYRSPHIELTPHGMANKELVGALANDRIRTQLIVSAPYTATINKETWHDELYDHHYDPSAFRIFSPEIFARQDPVLTAELLREILQMADYYKNKSIYQNTFVTPGHYYDRQSKESQKNPIKTGHLDYVIERVRQIYRDCALMITQNTK